MKTWLTFIAVVLVVVNAGGLWAAEQPDRAEEKEYQLKAICLYNFLKFTTWPEPTVSDSNNVKQTKVNTSKSDTTSPIIIGILGEGSFVESFLPLEKKTPKGRKVVIRQLGSFEKAENHERVAAKKVVDANSLRDCDLLFIANSEKKHTNKILDCLGSEPILTVGETEDFLEAGGMINFITTGNKVQFEINRDALDRVNIVIEPDVLRLALRVIGK